MGVDDFYQLFEKFVETQQLNPETADWLLKRILEILFRDSEHQNPNDE